MIPESYYMQIAELTTINLGAESLRRPDPARTERGDRNKLNQEKNMKTFPKMRFNLLPLMIAASLLFAGAACAQRVTNSVYIYFDSFARSNGPAPASLDGTAPDVVDTPGATWTANFTMQTVTNDVDGNLSALCQVVPSASLDPTTAYLPFTPQAGHVYTLSCDIDIFASSSFLAIGFQGETNSDYGYAPGVGPVRVSTLLGQCLPGFSGRFSAGGIRRWRAVPRARNLFDRLGYHRPAVGGRFLVYLARQHESAASGFLYLPHRPESYRNCDGWNVGL